MNTTHNAADRLAEIASESGGRVDVHAQLRAIGRDNALAQFPRLAAVVRKA